MMPRDATRMFGPVQPTRLGSAVLVAAALSACSAPAGKTPTNNVAAAPANQSLLLDFEKPEIAVTWAPAHASTTPATEPAADAGPLQRSSLRPQSGLWSMSVKVSDGGGSIVYTPKSPMNLGSFDLLSLQVMHTGTPAQNGEATACVSLTDADGKHFTSDAFAITAQWDAIGVDLKKAFDDGLDISHVVSVALAIHPMPPSAPQAADSGPPVTPEPLTVQTDTWAAASNARKYIGNVGGAAKSFYVMSTGTRIRVGIVDGYELALIDRGAKFAGDVPEAEAAPLPWMEVRADGRTVLGQSAPSGLMLLDPAAFEAIGGMRERGPDDVPRQDAGVHAGAKLPAISWPASLSPQLTQIRWEVVWTSPIAAIIQGRQEAGPFDHLGEPAVSVKWRLMIYQWGQVFVHAEWTRSGDIAPMPPSPITWALVQENRPAGIQLRAQNQDAQQRLLTEIYPATFRAGMTGALPHRMQTDAPVAMIARTNAAKDTWWWAAGKLSADADESRRYFGAAIVGGEQAGATGHAECMLLVNKPDALMQAASFGQYLVPPKITMRQGERDLTFPGDYDNDGFVETYGFQAIRLANGRATFTIQPQGRPIFYPAFLFTVPAVERDAVDLAHSKLLVTIDGKLFENMPQFAPGSYLLQIPFTLNEPVNVEAILVRN